MMKRSPLVLRYSLLPLLGLLLASLATVTARADEGLVLDTAPPKPVRVPAEFEPMQAVIADWESIRNADFYRYIVEDVNLILFWHTDLLYKDMQTKLPQYGVNMANCEFYKAVNTTIPRDFLPWLLFVDSNQPAFVFNTGRLSAAYAPEPSYHVYLSDLYVQGGDFMTDGQGTAVSLDDSAIYNDYQGEDLLARVRDYWGVHPFHLIPTDLIPKGTTVVHIDCVAKFLSPDTIMVLRYPSSHPLSPFGEATAAYFRRQVSCYGTPYRVPRLDVLNKEPYINSLIVNRRVFVPTENRETDANALATYRAAMPGYEVIGVTNLTISGRSLWSPNRALHCDTLGIADAKMLYIRHVPLLDRPVESEGFPIRAEIEGYSRTEFVEGTPIVLWRTVIDANEAQASELWNTVAMTPDPDAGDHQYLAYIPAQPVGTTIQYYLRAKDASGRDETHPYIGAAQAPTFAVTALGANVSAVSAGRGGAVEFYMNAGVENAQRTYRLAYAVSADPGAALPPTAVFTGFEGTLDESGIASAQMVLPEPLAAEWVGRMLCFSLDSSDLQTALPDAVCIQVLE